MRSHSVLLYLLTLLISQAFSTTITETTPVAAGIFCPSQHNKCVLGATNRIAFTTRCGYQTSGATPAFATNATDGRDCVNQCDAASNCVRVAYFGVQDGTMPYNCEGHSPATQLSNYRFSGGKGILFDSLTECTGGQVPSSITDAEATVRPKIVSSSVGDLQEPCQVFSFLRVRAGMTGRCSVELFPKS